MTSKAVLGPNHFTMAASTVWGAPASRKANAWYASCRPAASRVSPSTSGKINPCDRTAKCLTLLCICPGFVYGRLSCADALKSDQRTAVIKATHDLREPLAFGAQTMIDRHPHPVEEPGSPPGHVAADIFEACALESMHIAGDKKCTDALRALDFVP